MRNQHTPALSNSAPILGASEISTDSSSRARRIEANKHKEYLALELICRFGISSRKVASFFIDDPKGRIIKRMLEKKWICLRSNSRLPPYTLSFKAEHQVIVLTELGLRIFHQQRGDDIKYPELDSKNINFRNASHTLEGQIAIKRMLMKGLICNYQTERMIDPENKAGRKKFDLVVTLNTKEIPRQRVGIEIETSPKYDSELCETRGRIFKTLMRTNEIGQSEFAFVIYFIDINLLQRYESAFSAGEKIYRWMLNSNKKYEKSGVEFVIPRYLAARILFFPIIPANIVEVSK